MFAILRDFRPEDLPAVLTLNQGALPAVSTETVEGMARIAQGAPYARVAVRDGEVVGFLLALAPETPYESENFEWFRARHESFIYIDRVVIAESARGQGIGRGFYEDVERFARSRGAPLVTCEVNLRPRNEPSLRFHDRMGFRAVGTQDAEDGKKTVQLMSKTLNAT